MHLIDAMKDKLTAAFSPSHLSVADDSAAHYGHDGATPGRVSHVAILVVSDAFAGKSRVERSRMVHAAIGAEIRQVHAITQMKTLTPEEYGK